MRRLSSVETATSAQRPTASTAEALWRAWIQNGDVAARDRLVLSYAPMVKYLACRKVRELPAHCELDDLVSCGLLALIAAVDRFDPAKGATIERAREEWQSRHGRTPTDEELSGELEITVSDLHDQLEGLSRADLLSLNTPARGNEEAMPVEVGDTIEAPAGEFDPELAALAGERAAVLRDAIASLSEREQTILVLLYVKHMQGAEVGRMLGISESRVSQILSSIRRTLKERIDTYDSVV